MPKLIIERPGFPAETLELDDDSASIGRLPENTVQIEIPQCSRRHAQILRVARGFEITDLKSSNGTLINGRKKERHLLTHGDVIAIGDARITYRDEAAAAEEELEIGGECCVVFMSGERKGDQVRLGADRTTFGRGERNVVVLKDQMTSTYHCEITHEGDGYILRDLGSTNGSVVNNEPVSETTLSHGARIRLGKTRFVFVDPAVADYQKALAAEESAQEAEWGMMRAQVDMARVKKARRNALVWVAVFILLFGGAAAVFTLKPELVKGIFGVESGKGIAATHRLNKLGNDYSFENSLLTWRGPEGRQVTVRPVASEQDAHQGKAALSVGAGKRGWPPVVVRVGEPSQVSEGSNYLVAGWLRPRRGSRAAVGLIWSRASEEARMMSLSPWVRGGDWAEAELIVSPPKNLDQAQYVVVVAGDDAAGANLDDVDFHKVDTAAERPGVVMQKGSGNFKVHVSDHGCVSMLKGSSYRLWSGGFAGLTTEGDLITQQLCFRAESVETGADGGIVIKGELLVPGGDAAPVTVGVKPAADKVTVSLSLSGPAPSLVSWGIGFRIARDYLKTIRDHSKEPDGKLFFGQQSETRELLSVRGLEPSNFKTIRQGPPVITLLGPAGTGTRVYELETRLDEMRREAESLLSRAGSSRAAGEAGIAIQTYERIMQEYPFDDLVEAARNARNLVVEAGRVSLAELRAAYEAAGAFSDEGDLATTRSRVAAHGARFAGHSITEETAKLVSEIDGRLREIRTTREGGAADQLRRRAEDFKLARMPKLAMLFAVEVQKRFSAPEHQEWAKGFIDQLQAPK